MNTKVGNVVWSMARTRIQLCLQSATFMSKKDTDVAQLSIVPRRGKVAIKELSMGLLKLIGGLLLHIMKSPLKNKLLEKNCVFQQISELCYKGERNCAPKQTKKLNLFRMRTILLPLRPKQSSPNPRKP